MMHRTPGQHHPQKPSSLSCSEWLAIRYKNLNNL
jgi:hypothetical protein